MDQELLLLFPAAGAASFGVLLRENLFLFLRIFGVDSGSGKLSGNLRLEKAADLAARSYDNAAATSVLNCPRYLPFGPIRTSNLPFLVSRLTPKNRGCGVLDLSIFLLDFLDRLVAGLFEGLLSAVACVFAFSDFLLDSLL